MLGRSTRLETHHIQRLDLCLENALVGVYYTRAASVVDSMQSRVVAARSHGRCIREAEAENPLGAADDPIVIHDASVVVLIQSIEQLLQLLVRQVASDLAEAHERDESLGRQRGLMIVAQRARGRFGTQREQVVDLLALCIRYLP